MEAGLENANAVNNPFTNSNGSDALAQKDPLFNYFDGYKPNGTSEEEFFKDIAKNGRRSANDVFGDGDLGPETDVDAVDDGLMSPTAKVVEQKGNNNPFSDYCGSELEEKVAMGIDMKLQKHEVDLMEGEKTPREETPTPPAEEVHDGGLVDNVAESGDESEDEWNYYKGAEKENVPPSRSDREVADITGAEPDQRTKAQIEEEEAMSQLNPDAAEFVPISPTRVVESPICTALKGEPFLAQSPKRGTNTENVDINLPSPQDFDKEIKNRPSEVFSNGHGNGHKSSSLELMENLLNGKNIDEIEFQPNSTPKKVSNDEFHFGPNATPFSTPAKNLDQSALSTKANFGDETTASYMEEKTFENDSEDFQSFKKEQDPMSMSFYQDKDDNSDSLDLDKVQLIPENLEEFIEKVDDEKVTDLDKHDDLLLGVCKLPKSPCAVTPEPTMDENLCDLTEKQPENLIGEIEEVCQKPIMDFCGTTVPTEFANDDGHSQLDELSSQSGVLSPELDVKSPEPGDSLKSPEPNSCEIKSPDLIEPNVCNLKSPEPEVCAETPEPELSEKSELDTSEPIKSPDPAICLLHPVAESGALKTPEPSESPMKSPVPSDQLEPEIAETCDIVCAKPSEAVKSPEPEVCQLKSPEPAELEVCPLSPEPASDNKISETSQPEVGAFEPTEPEICLKESSELDFCSVKSSQPEICEMKSPEPLVCPMKSPEPDVLAKSPVPEICSLKTPEPNIALSPEPELVCTKSQEPELVCTKSPEPELVCTKSPEPELLAESDIQKSSPTSPEPIPDVCPLKPVESPVIEVLKSPELSAAVSPEPSTEEICAKSPEVPAVQEQPLTCSLPLDAYPRKPVEAEPEHLESPHEDVTSSVKDDEPLSPLEPDAIVQMEEPVTMVCEAMEVPPQTQEVVPEPKAQEPEIPGQIDLESSPEKQVEDELVKNLDSSTAQKQKPEADQEKSVEEVMQTSTIAAASAIAAAAAVAAKASPKTKTSSTTTAATKKPATTKTATSPTKTATAKPKTAPLKTTSSKPAVATKSSSLTKAPASAKPLTSTRTTTAAAKPKPSTTSTTAKPLERKLVNGDSTAAPKTTLAARKPAVPSTQSKTQTTARTVASKPSLNKVPSGDKTSAPKTTTAKPSGTASARSMTVSAPKPRPNTLATKSATATKTSTSTVNKSTTATKTVTSPPRLSATTAAARPKPASSTTAAAPKPRVPLSSRPIAKAPDAEKQNKENVNKLTASRTSASKTTLGSVTNKTSTVRKTEAKTSTGTVKSTTKTTTTTTTKLTPKKPTAVPRKSATPTKTTTSVTKVSKPTENGIPNGVITITEEINTTNVQQVATTNGHDDFLVVKDQSPIVEDNSIIIMD